MSIISVKNLNFQEALENISFTVEKGDFIGLAGPNGAGKTTLIKLILGLFKADQGEIKILNTNIAQFKDWDKVGYLPQKREQLNRIFPATVFEVVATGLTENKNKDKKVNEALKLLRISDLKQRNFFAISGGQQQRVLLARSIVCDPEIIFLDEPSNALDPKTRDEFFETLNYLNKEKGKTVILITHDTGAVGQYAQKLLYLDKSIVYYGNFKNFCENQEMGKYFGTSAQHLICHQH